MYRRAISGFVRLVARGPPCGKRAGFGAHPWTTPCDVVQGSTLHCGRGAAVVQLDRILGSYPGNGRFESARPHSPRRLVTPSRPWGVNRRYPGRSAGLAVAFGLLRAVPEGGLTGGADGWSLKVAVLVSDARQPFVVASAAATLQLDDPERFGFPHAYLRKGELPLVYTIALDPSTPRWYLLLVVTTRESDEWTHDRNGVL